MPEEAPNTQNPDAFPQAVQSVLTPPAGQLVLTDGPSAYINDSTGPQRRFKKRLTIHRSSLEG